MKCLHSEKLMALLQPQQTVDFSNFDKHSNEVLPHSDLRGGVFLEKVSRSYGGHLWVR